MSSICSFENDVCPFVSWVARHCMSKRQLLWLLPHEPHRATHNSRQEAWAFDLRLPKIRKIRVLFERGWKGPRRFANFLEPDIQPLQATRILEVLGGRTIDQCTLATLPSQADFREGETGWIYCCWDVSCIVTLHRRWFTHRYLMNLWRLKITLFRFAWFFLMTCLEVPTAAIHVIQYLESRKGSWHAEAWPFAMFFLTNEALPFCPPGGGAKWQSFVRKLDVLCNQRKDVNVNKETSCVTVCSYRSFEAGSREFGFGLGPDEFLSEI